MNEYLGRSRTRWTRAHLVLLSVLCVLCVSVVSFSGPSPARVEMPPPLPPLREQDRIRQE